jgi:hypothetical protein
MSFLPLGFKYNPHACSIIFVVWRCIWNQDPAALETTKVKEFLSFKKKEINLEESKRKKLGTNFKAS